MRLLVVLPLFAAFASANLERRAQPGAVQPPPVELRPLTWGDVNFISTTDSHGWLAGHPRVSDFSADFGDFASFVKNMRKKAERMRKDLFVIDSGDLHDGNGLSDSTPLNGQVSDPIFSAMKYDMLTIGNHELYQNSVAESMHKNYAPKWGKRYLTSNVYIKDANTNKTTPIGHQYSVFHGRYGTKVLAYGFLFNFKSNGNMTVVEKVETTIAQPWFQKSLKVKSDVIVVVSHMSLRYGEALSIVNAIRKVQPTKPLFLFGGHLHIRDFVRYDGRAAGIASGRFMETVGWMSASGIRNNNKNLTITRRYLNANLHTYKTHALAHPKQKFDSGRGKDITKKITKARKALNLTNILGYSPQDYYLSRYPMTDDRSLLKLVANEVLPAVVDPKKGKPGVVIINSGSQRFDVLKGPFTTDDTFVVSPFHNTFIYTTVKASLVKGIMEGLNTAPFQKRADKLYLENLRENKKGGDQKDGKKPGKNYPLTPGYVTKDDMGTDGDDWPHTPIADVDAPTYIASPLPAGVQPDDEVHIVWLSFFTNLIEPLLKKLDPNTNFALADYRTDINSNTMWANFVTQKWAKQA
ncbi:hypothetical protein DFQ26_008415 [Actinomortierella ambigua]|nr:hypothetical protein DFQ26_008415 [Actinomortierella ambigua]